MTPGPSTGAARAEALQASLRAVRQPRASGPGPEADTLRRAYLDLLKLCLTDLAGTATVSVGPTPDGVAVARELSGDHMQLRAAGLDWPFQGLTMGGLSRLDDLQSCVSAVVRDGVQGDLIEAGAWRGGSSILMRATLDSLGDDRAVWVADSFEGFVKREDTEEVDGDVADLHAYLSDFEFLAVSVQEVRDNFVRLGCERGVNFVRGLFQDTLPGLADRRWAIVRLDGDSYEATRVALASLYPGLAPGGYLIVDDYGVTEECRQAVDEFRAEHGITEPLQEVDWSCVRWRREGGRRGEGEREGAAAQGNGAMAEPAGPGQQSLSVPTVSELILKGEMERPGADLAEAEAEVAKLGAGLAQAQAEIEQLRAALPRARLARLRDRVDPRH